MHCTITSDVHCITGVVGDINTDKCDHTMLRRNEGAAHSEFYNSAVALTVQLLISVERHYML